jgi:ubiquinone biosynthesis protein UbiJ
LFAARWQMDDLQQDTRLLNQNLDRAEAKIQQLQRQIDVLPDSI